MNSGARTFSSIILLGQTPHKSLIPFRCITASAISRPECGRPFVEFEHAIKLQNHVSDQYIGICYLPVNLCSFLSSSSFSSGNPIVGHHPTIGAQNERSI